MGHAACLICHHTQDDTGRTACRSCEHRIRGWLAELPRQLPLLQDSLQLDGGPAQRGGGGRAHSPLPLRLDVLTLLGPGSPVLIEDPHGDQSAGIPITALLYGWARYIAGEHHCDSAASRYGSGIPAWCAWLTAYVPYAITRPWVGEFYDQLDEVVRRVRGITRTTPRRHVKLAPCPCCKAFALIAIDGEWYVQCENCPQLLTPDEYEAHSARVLPGLTTLAVLISANTSAGVLA